jgi:hypothetical protein
MAQVLEGDRSSGDAQCLRSPRTNNPIPRRNRDRDLLRVGLFFEHEIREDVPGRRWIIRRLEDLARRDRRLGQSGHWSYDAGRHQAVLSVLKDERDELSAILAARQKGGSDA